MFESIIERLRWPLRAAFVLCLLLILYLALDPIPLLKGASSDKVNHVLAFFGLGVLLRLGWPRFRFVWMAIALLGLGVFIEVVQHFIGRDAAFGDVLADALGIALAALATQIFRIPQQASLPD